MRKVTFLDLVTLVSISEYKQEHGLLPTKVMLFSTSGGIINQKISEGGMPISDNQLVKKMETEHELRRSLGRLHMYDLINLDMNLTDDGKALEKIVKERYGPTANYPIVLVFDSNMRVHQKRSLFGENNVRPTDAKRE